MATKIQIRRDTLQNWTDNNPVLSSGEISFVTDLNKIKVGDGTQNWLDLEYLEAEVNKVFVDTKTDSYTLAVADVGKVIEMNVASANNLTIPLNSSVAIPVGSTIDIVQYGEGQTTLVPESGVEVRSKEGALKITGQYSAVTLYKRGTDEWVAIGDLSS